MSRETEKQAAERAVFEDFVNRANIPVRRESIRAGNASIGEPDIICLLDDGTQAGFELGRLIDPNLAKIANKWEPQNAEFTWTSDPSTAIARKKLEKTYQVAFPVQLLLYKENPIITPDDVIVPSIRPICYRRHQYSKVWFMGDSVKLLFER